jgi:hypothetical protein
VRPVNFIHHSALRRVVLPAAFAIAVAAAVELCIQVAFHPTFWQKTTWLLHDPYRDELFDRAELSIRLSHVENSAPDIISVGDSSGFFSLQSTVVNRYLGGRKFVSLNTGANQAYLGYQAIAEYMLRRSKGIKYVVLYVFPLYLPFDGIVRFADLSPITYNALVGPQAALTPPSAFLSPYAKFEAFEGQPFDPTRPPAFQLPALQLSDTVDDALGWLPEFDVRSNRFGRRPSFFSDQRPDWYLRLGSRFGVTDPSSTNVHLDEFDRMVRSYGAQLVVAFGPLARHIAQPDELNLVAAEQALERFQREHPDVKFLFPLLTEWGIEKFGALNHISREYTFLSSERLGKALAQLLRDPDSIPPFKARGEPAPYPPLSVTPAGPEDPSLLEPALALYLYTSTDDEKYRALLSSRVTDLLAREPAFADVMADERARIASLAKRNTKIGFDLSQLHAVPVALKGMPHCNADQTVQWVHVYGAMTFTYQSPLISKSESIAWPNGIYVPTVVEDGVRKFDGYCPEPSMAENLPPTR